MTGSPCSVNSRHAVATLERLDLRTLLTASAFDPGQNVVTGDKPVQALFADVNADGHNDMIVACAGTNSKGIWVHLADASGTIGGGVRFATADPVNDVVVDDFNHDGNVDIAYATSGALNALGLPILNGLKSLSLLTGDGHGAFTAFSSYTLPVGSNDLATGDYNNDGVSDVAVTNALNNTVSVMISNPADGTSGNPRTQNTGLAPNGLVAGDFNEDGKTDLIVTSLTSLQFFPGVGNGDFGTAVTVRSNLNLGAALAIVKPVVADFNGDGHLDLALAGMSTTVATLNGAGDGTFTDGTASTMLPSASMAALSSGDLNHDGINDLVAIDQTTHNVVVETLNADGTIAATIQFAGGLGASALAMSDITGDGKLDLASIDTDADVIHVFRNVSAGSAVALYDEATHTLHVAGTPEDNTITLSAFATQLVVTRDGVRATYTAADIRGIFIEGGDGNDRIDASTLVRSVYVQAGAGNDTVLGGSANDRLRGGAGSDLIDGGAGDDRLEGWKGRDSIRGGDGNDRLYGDDGQDMLDGNGGADRLYGGTGNDTLIGGAGNDYLYGDVGSDFLYGNAGNDHFDGGSGRDRSDAVLGELNLFVELKLR